MTFLQQNRQLIAQQKGQTLIEVVIAAGLIVLVLATLASGIAIGVRNSRVAKDQALSKEYVRETLEWLRNMRDQTGWDTFATITKSGTYCMQSLPTSPTFFAAQNTGACGTTATIGSTYFKRELLIEKTGTPPTSITATATVTWPDGAKTFTSRSELTLYEWRP